MDLLTNAVESIRVGIEDYKAASRGRLLSAVRNIHAGVLLLFKEALRRKSPADSEDILVKAKNMPRLNEDGTVSFVGVGKKTVDVQQIRERFEGLGINVDWTRLERINKTRNDVEHYYPTLAPEALHGLVADTFELVRRFVDAVLEEDPAELLGTEAWQVMLEVAEVHAAEREECQRLLDAVPWESATLANGVRELTCQLCGAQLLRPDERSPGDSVADLVLRCRRCDGPEAAHLFVARAIELALGDRTYHIKDGGEIPYVNCPECGIDAYVIDEGRCAHCGHEAQHTCDRCGSPIPPEELDTSPLCGWCAHMVSKDD